MHVYRCLDRPNCGDIFAAFNDKRNQPFYCPYCGEGVAKVGTVIE